MAGRVQASSDDEGLDTKKQGAHFVFVPLMTQGHLIPAVDTALLLAANGALCTIVGTPAMTALLRPTVESAPVRLVDFPLDYARAGLPDGADSSGSVPAMYLPSYIGAMALLRAPVEAYLRDHPPYPTCVVSDFCHPWTSRLARDLGVPRLSFFSMCAFFLLCQRNVERFDAFNGVEGDDELVVVPGLEELERRVEVTRPQASPLFGAPGLERLAEDVERAQAEADGVLVNTFLELEPEFVAGYAAASGTKVWAVGPVSLYHHHQQTLAERGGKKNQQASSGAGVMRWLDEYGGRKPGSVVYVSFGSLLRPTARQAVELGLGLEASGHPFIWALGGDDEYDEATRNFLRELEARVAGRGLLLRGWAPQVRILSHAAVGGFVTHCGWNSTLEAVAAGLPVVTWPHFADQFLNEKMAVEVLRVGVSVGVTEPAAFRMDGKEVVVGRDAVESAVRSLMDGGEEGDQRRRRAKELAAKARAATLQGGSSHTNLLDLVNRFQNSFFPEC